MKNLVQSFIIGAVIFSGLSAFAHHEDKNGPCKTFWASCKDTKGKKAKKECVKAAADADTVNGPACTESMSHKHKHLDKQADKDQPQHS